MNWLDAVLGVIILLGAVTGWQRGFVRATLFLATLVASVLIALLTYRWPEDWLHAALPTSGVWAAPASFLLIFIVARLLLDRLAQALIGSVPRKVHAHVLNSVLGVLPGLGSGAINAAVLTLVLATVPTVEAVSTAVRESELADRLTQPAEWLQARLLPIFDPAVRRTLQALTVPVDSKTSVALPFKVAQAGARPDLEARMLEMVNAERAQRGLKPLRADPEVVEVARAHSRDMFARGYFSHVTPEGASLADRLRKQQVRFVAAGENLALARSLAIAHQGLMDSPGHRANILRPQFGRAGIGVLDGGVHGLMITQDFRN
jgi:uncharacterized protein YkwD